MRFPRIDNYPRMSSVSYSRIYHDAALHRWDDALACYRQGNYLGAIYLAGYAAECMLKYAIIQTLFVEKFSKKETVDLTEFREERHIYFPLTTHNLTRLMKLGNTSLAVLDGREVFERPVAREFEKVTKWRSEWRYSTDRAWVKKVHADAFLQEIIEMISQLRKSAHKGLKIGELQSIEIEAVRGEE